LNGSDRSSLTWRWDADSDAGYIDFAPGLKGRATVSTEDDRVAADIADGVLVGIEILNVSTHPIFRQLLPKDPGVETVEMRI